MDRLFRHGVLIGNSGAGDFLMRPRDSQISQIVLDALQAGAVRLKQACARAAVQTQPI